MKNIRERIEKILIENFGLYEKDVKADKELESLGVDSIIAIEIQIDLEKEFNIKIPDGEILLSFTIKDIHKYIQSKVKNYG